MAQQVKSKLGQNAKVFRFISRAQMFRQKRKTYDELDYLKYYTHQVKQAILHSMRSPVPQPLPPLSLQTISFYRRKSQPVFRTKNPQTQHLEGHMIYQSLWILSSIDQKFFEDYQSIVKEFQKELPELLSANSSDIREMAVITAGNKIIGKEQQILNIVSKDPRQLWVLVNHIYDNKISYKKLFPFIVSHEQLAYKTIFELTLTVQKEIAQTIVNEEGFVVHIVEAIRAENQTIRKLAMRIVGNIVAENSQYFPIFMDSNILDRLMTNLSCSSPQVRKDACWLISNLSLKKKSATQILRHQNIIKKLVDLFSTQVIPFVQKEITYIFCYLAHFAQKNEVFKLLAHENVLNICYNQLQIEDVDLNTVTLFLLKELLQLGDNFKGEGDNNFFIYKIKSMEQLHSEISKMSYSEQNQISSTSEQIINLLQDEEDY